MRTNFDRPAVAGPARAWRPRGSRRARQNAYRLMVMTFALVMLALFGIACAGQEGEAVDSAGGSVALVAPVLVELTEDRVDRWSEATANLERVETERPEVARRTLASDDVPIAEFGPDRVDAAVERLQADSVARLSIERTGLSVRDYVLTTLALQQAVLAAREPERYSGIPQANVDFVRRRGDLVAGWRDNRWIGVDVDDDADGRRRGDRGLHLGHYKNGKAAGEHPGDGRAGDRRDREKDSEKRDRKDRKDDRKDREKGRGN